MFGRLAKPKSQLGGDSASSYALSSHSHFSLTPKPRRRKPGMVRVNKRLVLKCCHCGTILMCENRNGKAGRCADKTER